MRRLKEESKREMVRLLQVAKFSACETEADRSLIEYGAVLCFMMRENFISPQDYVFKFDEIKLIREQRLDALSSKGIVHA